MSNLTLEQIDNFLTSTDYGKPVSIPYGDFSVTVKTTLTEAEKRAFINRVVEDSYVNNVNYSPINNKITFITTFAEILTDLPIPIRDNDENTVDVDKLYKIVDGLHLLFLSRENSPSVCALLDELKICIKQEIDFKNQKLIAMYGASSASDEAIEKFSLMMSKGVELLDLTIDIVLKNGNKLSKYLTPKNIDKFMGLVKEKDVSMDKTSNIINFDKIKTKEDSND